MHPILGQQRPAGGLIGEIAVIQIIDGHNVDHRDQHQSMTCMLLLMICQMKGQKPYTSIVLS